MPFDTTPLPIAAPPTAPDLEKWRRLLLEAADYMNVHGYCRGKESDAQGRVCALGALRQVCFTQHYNRYDLKAAQNRLGSFVRGSVGSWNDRLVLFPKTRAVATLRACARQGVPA